MHFTLCDLFSDLTQNSVEAGANTITVDMHIDEQRISFGLRDNGKGMSKELLKKVTDPFYTDGVKHPGRKVGLGIPFLIQTAESTEGTWSINSCTGDATKASGTTVLLDLQAQHIDLPPLGDLANFFRQILSFDAFYEMKISANVHHHEVELVRSEILEAMDLLEEGNFTDVQALSLLRQYIDSLLTEE